jgi:hypothetical protein
MVNPLGWATTDKARLARISDTITDPKLFDPEDLRGMPAGDLRRLLEPWGARPVTDGDGLKFVDPSHRGRQFRIMEGYPGNRPDPMTHGPYAVVSQNGAKPVKVPLEGNPTL